MKTKKLTLAAILTALAMILSYIERFIPLEMLFPLPGVKLGLANTVTLFSLFMLDFPSTLCILIMRCILGALFSGSITGLAFSLAGGLLSMGVMILSKRCPFLSVYGVSVLGAAAHSCGQILTAMLLMGSPNVLGYLPYLLAISVLCGIATAGVTGSVIRITDKNLFIIRR